MVALLHTTRLKGSGSTAMSTAGWFFTVSELTMTPSGMSTLAEAVVPAIWLMML